jgi:hypothetical protein
MALAVHSHNSRAQWPLVAGALGSGRGQNISFFAGGAVDAPALEITVSLQRTDE